MGVGVLPAIVIVIVIVIRAKGADYGGVLLEMDCQVHESYALVLQ